MHCPGRDESVEFLQLKDALITLKFGAQETEDMFKALASILHIGNLRYTESVKGNSYRPV